LIWTLLEIPLFLIHRAVLPARACMSTQWTVEAVCWWPSEQRQTWSVGAGDRDRVTAEIADAVQDGRWVTPVGSVLLRQSLAAWRSR
jgi:hypothetical protein